MINNPKVSVLVPIYNNEIYLQECIESIINQTLKDIEIILLDDGSTDNSPQICDEYAKKDSRIKVIHKPNSGYGATMNIGIDNASGEYIGIVESDDYIELDMFETLYNNSIQNNQKMDIVNSNITIFFGDKENRRFVIGRSYNKYNQVLKPKEYPKIIAYNSINIYSAIYKKSFLTENNIRLNETPGASFQDAGFHIQTYLLANTFYALDKSFYRLRRDNPNSSVYNKDKVFCICEEYNFIENFLNKHNFNKSILNAVLYKKFNSYYYRIEIAGILFGLDFIKKIKKDFKNIKDEDLEFFSDKEKIQIKSIIKNPKEFFIKQFTIYKTIYNIKLFNLINIIKLIKINYKTYIKFMSITIIKIKQSHNKTKVYLFDFLPILTIRKI